jgi:hypothetical protein
MMGTLYALIFFTMAAGDRRVFVVGPTTMEKCEGAAQRFPLGETWAKDGKPAKITGRYCQSDLHMLIGCTLKANEPMDTGPEMTWDWACPPG